MIPREEDNCRWLLPETWHFFRGVFPMEHHRRYRDLVIWTDEPWLGGIASLDVRRYLHGVTDSLVFQAVAAVFAPASFYSSAWRTKKMYRNTVPDTETIQLILQLHWLPELSAPFL